MSANCEEHCVIFSSFLTKDKMYSNIIAKNKNKNRLNTHYCKINTFITLQGI